MKTHRFIAYILLSFYSVIMIAQDAPSINDFNFESVSNPSFILLDETPTSFSTPDNLKALGLYLSNGLGNANVAVEMNPYWILGWNKEDKSYEEFRGISTSGDKVRINPFQRIKTNSSISFAFVDKEFPNFESARKTLTVGGRFTLLELYNTPRVAKLNEILSEVIKKMPNEVLEKFDGFVRGPVINHVTPGPEACAESLDSGTYPSIYTEAAASFYENNQELVNAIYSDAATMLKAYFDENCRVSSAFVFNAQNIQPVFRLDGAAGYSWLFKENNFDAATANRFGSWLTADLAIRFTDEQYLHVFGIGKYIRDGFQIDENGDFFTEGFYDYGGKIELELKKFKLSYEYLQRKSGKDERYRSVGNLYYQLTKSISITGGFGKDFQAEDNLISILGISWGIDSGENPFGG